MTQLNLDPQHCRYLRLPTPLCIQETDLVLYIEDVEKGGPGAEEDSVRILVFLKVYDPVARTLKDAGKIYPTRYRYRAYLAGVQDLKLFPVLWIRNGFFVEPDRDTDKAFNLNTDPNRDPDLGSQTNADSSRSGSWSQQAEFLHEKYALSR
jgi:hypothetical protein